MGKMRPDSRLKDEYLAELTDQILEGKEPAGLETPSDKELVELQKTISYVKRAIGPKVEPNQAMAKRIHTTIMKEWREVGPRQETQRAQWRSMSSIQRQYAFRFAIISMLFLLVAVILTPKLETILPGTAEGKSLITPIVVIVIVISSLTIWFLRNKRKGG